RQERHPPRHPRPRSAISSSSEKSQGPTHEPKIGIPSVARSVYNWQRQDPPRLCAKAYPQTGWLLISDPRNSNKHTDGPAMTRRPLPFAKPATTYAEQVAILERRGMDVDDHAAAEFYLQHLNYYRLSAYWLPFEASHTPHTFIPGTRFTDV